MQPADGAAGMDAAVAAHRELIGELAEQLAHALANHMAVARLTAEVLATQSDLPEALAARLATVVRATTEAGDLVQHLSVLAGRRPSPAHDLDLATVVHELSGLLRAALGRRPLELAVVPARVVADRRDVEEVLLRLVLAGGPAGADRPISLTVRAEGNDVVAVVRRPSAVPAAAMARVTALASVTTVPADDGGEEHVVRFPAGNGAPARMADAAPGACILVVEDDPDLRDLVCDALRNDGYLVDGVADAASALAHPVVTEGRLELLMTDVELPGMSGLALAEGLLLTGVAVVVMSGHGEAALRELLPEGARVLDKPFGVPDLRAVVREALAP